MQVSSIDSLSPHSSINASSDANALLPLIDKVANIDTRPQTISFVQDSEVVVDTNRNPILPQLRGTEQRLQVLLQESEENQLTSVLKSLFKLDELYHDEDLLKLLIKKDDHRKYCYAELFTSALYAQAAWYRLKNRVLELMHFIPLGRNKSIAKGKLGLSIAVTNIINNKIKHQTYLDKIQSENFDEQLSSTRSATGKKTSENLNEEIKKAKKTLGENRREYLYSLAQRDIEENAIIENIPQYFLDSCSLEAIKKIFVSLSEEEIKALIQNNISSLPSPSVNEMEKHEFKIQRKPVPESFWNLLEKCTEQDWKAFNKYFFLFLLSSWLSEPEYLLRQRRDLKEAIATNNTRKKCSILIDKSLQISLNVGAKRILHQILVFAKAHESLMSEENADIAKHTLIEDHKQWALTMLNDSHTSIFVRAYQPYVDRKKINWNLKTLGECLAQISLLNDEICMTRMGRRHLPSGDGLDVRRFLDFIYAVLLHFRDNYSAQLVDLNNIATRTIAKPAAQQAQTRIRQLTAQSLSTKEKYQQNEQSQANALEVTTGSLKRKRKEKYQQSEEWTRFMLERNFQISPASSPETSTDLEAEIHYPTEISETAEDVALSLTQEMQWQQLMEDIQEITDKNYPEIAMQEQIFAHEECHSVLDSIIDERSKNPLNHIITPMVYASETEVISSNRVLNFDPQQTISGQDKIFQQFPEIFQAVPINSNIQEETLTTGPYITLTDESDE